MNSTAVVLMIITVLTYGIVCIGKRMELMDAVTVSFAVLLAGFGMSGGILALFGRFSLNKTLAVLWLLSVVAAVICRIAGGKPNVCLKQTESIVRPFLRTLILLIATMISTPAAFAWLIASTVCGITPSSAATTKIAISVEFAPRIRIAVNASCPGVSENVIF